MSMTDTDQSTGQPIPSPRRNGSGASSGAQARAEQPSLSETGAEGGGDLKTRAMHARTELKAKAEEARAAATERLAQARVKAGELATTAQQKATDGGKAAVAHVRAHPVRSALIAGVAAGVAVGVAMALRQNHARKLAARSSHNFWSDYGKVLLPLAAALAVPAKAVGDAAPGIVAKGRDLAKNVPGLNRVLH